MLSCWPERAAQILQRTVPGNALSRAIFDQKAPLGAFWGGGLEIIPLDWTLSGPRECPKSLFRSKRKYIQGPRPIVNTRPTFLHRVSVPSVDLEAPRKADWESTYKRVAKAPSFTDVVASFEQTFPPFQNHLLKGHPDSMDPESTCKILKMFGFYKT